MKPVNNFATTLAACGGCRADSHPMQCIGLGAPKSIGQQLDRRTDVRRSSVAPPKARPSESVGFGGEARPSSEARLPCSDCPSGQPMGRRMRTTQRGWLVQSQVRLGVRPPSRGVALLATGRQVFAKDAEQQGCEGWVAFIGGAFSRTSSASRPSEGIGDASRAIGMQADITATIFGARVSYIEIR